MGGCEVSFIPMKIGTIIPTGFLMFSKFSSSVLFYLISILERTYLSKIKLQDWRNKVRSQINNKSNGLNRQKALKTGGGEGGTWQGDRAHVGCATQAGIPPSVETRASETTLKRSLVRGAATGLGGIRDARLTWSILGMKFRRPPMRNRSRL